MNLETIPLSKLVPAACNVRKTGAIVIEDLAASIAAHGLLQNLQVRPLVRANGKPTGKYEVVAGGRRLAALKRLVKEGLVQTDYLVPCNVLGTEDGAEISLAENVIRQAMHPADQFEAFAALASQGHDAEEIAARFGATSAHVRKLLRLATVSPTLMAAYRDGAMTLDQLMAFTVSDDQAAQERVWSEQPGLTASSIRRVLTEAWVDAQHRCARFIGLDAYVAAGGAIVRDLFQEDHEGYLTDRALLDRLARQKLERLAEELRKEGWQWAEIIPDYRYPAAHGFTQLAPEKAPLSEADAVEQDALATEYDALASSDVDDTEAAERMDAIDARLCQLSEKMSFWPETTKAIAGAAIYLRQDGTAVVERGLVHQADLPEVSNDNQPPEKKPRPALNSGLVRDLTAHRTAALRATLAEQPDIALDALAYTLAIPVFYQGHGLESCLQIATEHFPLRKDAEDIDESPALQRIQKQHSAWQRKLPEAGAFRAWLQEQPQGIKLELLAFCAAQTLHAVQPRLDATRPASLFHADALHLATGLDMADWWQPTRGCYLGRVSKPQILEALTEGVSRSCADGYRERKRDRLIDIAEAKLAGTRWLPPLLRQPVPIDTATEAVPGDAEGGPSLLQAA